MPFDGTSPKKTHRDIERLLAARAQVAWYGGWTKRAYSTGYAVCAWQAISLCSDGDTAHLTRLVARELPWLYWLIFNRRAQIILFNDRSSTTKQDVVDLFDRAIARRQAEITREEAQLCLT